MGLWVFYGFVALALASAIVVVTSRNVVHSAFSLMVTLFCVAAFYVYLGADFLAAIQLLVYVGGILVLVLFGVMMTSGRLVMKLEAPVGQVAPAVLVGAVLLGLLLYIVGVQSPFRQRLLVEDPTASRAAELDAARKERPTLGRVEAAPVQRRAVVRFTVSGPPTTSPERVLARAVEDAIHRAGIERLYVLRAARSLAVPGRYEVLVEKRATSLLNDGLDVTDAELAAMRAALDAAPPEGFTGPEVIRSPLLLVRGVSDASRRLLIGELGWEEVEDPRTAVGLGDAVMMGEFLLPFEVAGLLLLVALLGAAVVSRKGVLA
jgi:NADH:ubiquinone oxidoreductase subunit 6 (subunit J)